MYAQARWAQPGSSSPYAAGGAPSARSAAIRSRRGAPASRSTILITAANGTARIAPTTPRSELAISTATIVVNGESSTAWR